MRHLNLAAVGKRGEDFSASATSVAGKDSETPLKSGFPETMPSEIMRTQSPIFRRHA